MTLDKPSNQGTILVVEDDPDMRDLISDYLVGVGYRVLKAENGAAASRSLTRQDIDLAIVDLGLPDADGLDLVRRIKERPGAGVIILSGRSETTEKVVGLEVGADDYVSKPFEARELLARVRSVIRRSAGKQEVSPAAGTAYVFDGWKLDLARRELTSPEEMPVDISSGEYNLLEAFVTHPNRVLSRDQLLDLTHKEYSPAFDRSIDVQVGRLRKQIEKTPGNPQKIKTVRNAGYIFTPKVSRA